MASRHSLLPPSLTGRAGDSCTHGALMVPPIAVVPASRRRDLAAPYGPPELVVDRCRVNQRGAGIACVHGCPARSLNACPVAASIMACVGSRGSIRRFGPAAS
jgi:hypothetical protein